MVAQSGPKERLKPFLGSGLPTGDGQQPHTGSSPVSFDSSDVQGDFY